MQLLKHTVQSDWQISRGKLCCVHKWEIKHFDYTKQEAQALPVPFNHSEYRSYQKSLLYKKQYKAFKFTVNASNGSK